jgi:hypothetical protein
MQEFTNWTVKTIRDDKLIGSWLEERKFDWIPLIAKMINNIIHKNKTVLILTDENRIWFKRYILNKINSFKNARPLLPFYDFNSCVKIPKINTQEEIDLIKDMLDISFPNGYIFWYIGRGQAKEANLAKISSNSLLWVFDEDIQNSFSLSSKDETLDFKLLQMYRLLNKTIEAVLFADIEVDR